MNVKVSAPGAATLHSGFVPGLDLVRLTAATAVLLSHAFPITTGSNRGHEPLFVLSGGRLTIGELAVMVFFVVSGFLIAQSAERTNNLVAFSLNCALRIMPALIVVVLLTMIVLGPAVTDLPLVRYIAAPETRGYIANAMFLPTSGELPGVFVANPFPNAVNGSLWTLRFEVACYVLLAASWFVLRGRAGWAQAAVIIAAIMRRCFSGHRYSSSTSPRSSSRARRFTPSAAAWSCRRSGVIACLVLMIASVPAGLFMAVGPLALGYVVLWLGMALRAPRWLGGVDYSYGIYLYAFPIQQTVEMLLPGLWWQNALLSLPPTLLLAACSWHLIEAPAMRWFKHLKPVTAQLA